MTQQLARRPNRDAALAAQDRAIDESTARAMAAPRRQTAIQAMAQRLAIEPARLMTVLRSTAFKGANEDEFAALLVVANEYGLNPLTKEIYAFKAQGGGIVPLVSIDGWIAMMNRHPQFDGYEHNDIFDEAGNFEAVETVIYRRDRTRPIKVTEYLDECQRNTQPWRDMPRRMLRHKSLIQACRIAFGFSGVNDEEEYQIVQGGDLTPVRMPSADELTQGQTVEQEKAFDADTGEVYEDPASDDEEIQRQLDAQTGDMGYDPQPEYDAAQEEVEPEWQDAYNTLLSDINSAKSIHSVESAEARFKTIASTLPDDRRKFLFELIASAKARFKK